MLARKVLEARARAIKAEGGRLVFTNGCFDLLHVGHVRYLKAAKTEGDVLLVAINSDDSVARIKGPGRPIVEEGARAEVVAALACVDYVTIFDEPDPLATIRMVQPDVLAKGADWEANAIVGKTRVEERGGRVVRIPLTKGASTSALIEEIVRLRSGRS